MQRHLHISPLKLMSILRINSWPQDIQFIFVCVLVPLSNIYSVLCARHCSRLRMFMNEQGKQRSLPSCSLASTGGDKQETQEIVNKCITQYTRM